MGRDGFGWANAAEDRLLVGCRLVLYTGRVYTAGESIRHDRLLYDFGPSSLGV